MLRQLFSVALFAAAPALLVAADDVPGFVVHTGHFEKNNSGLKGDTSTLLLTDADAFSSVFGTVPPSGLGGGRRNNPVTADTFEKNLVAAVIKRGKAITTYSEVSTSLKGDTLTVNFKSQIGQPGSASFASPLVVSVPKGKIAKVVFVENGKEIGTAK